MYQSLRSYVGKNAKLPGYMDYLHLSTSDVANLKESWAVLEDNISKVGVEFFLDILNHHEEIKGSFRQNQSNPAYEIKANEDLYKHGLYVLAAIKKIVCCIDDTEFLEKFFDDLSDKHRKAGVDASSMDVFGKVFCKVMRPILLDKKKWKPEIKDSWMTFFSSIVKVMKKNEMKVGENPVEGDDQDHRNELRHQVFKRNQYDRHLMQVGCDTFTQLFSQHPEVLDYLADYDTMVAEGINVGDALRSHAMAVGSVVGEIQENAGNPERIRLSLAAAGQRRYLEGVERRQLDMLGPVLAQAIRPLVWEKGLWSTELEKAWTHLFDIVACLMKLGYPPEYQEEETFPNLTELVLLKDTWAIIRAQVTQLSMETFQQLFALNSDMAHYLPDAAGEELHNTTQAVKSHATHIMTLLDRLMPALPDLQETATLLAGHGEAHARRGIDSGLLDMLGPVFCNTTRPFLLSQGKWSLDVERAWLALFKELAAAMREGY